VLYEYLLVLHAPMTEQLILVDEQDNQIGTAEKLEAHQQALLHRAISILLFHLDGRILLQLRGKYKYHGGGRRTTTTCSHPRVGETTEAAATRRLHEEMGITCELHPKSEFIYKADVGSGLREHEYLHVFSGIYDGPVVPNPEEADGYRRIELPLLQELLEAHPERFSPRFKITVEKIGLFN